MKEPRTVKWIRYLLIFHLGFFLLLIPLMFYALHFPPERGLINILPKILAFKMEESPYQGLDYAMGYWSGVVGLPIILTLLLSMFLKRKKQIGFWVTYAFYLLFSVAATYLPFIQIVVLILGLLKPTRLYWSGKQPDNGLIDSDLYNNAQ